MTMLKVGAAKRVELAFHPKTPRCYELLFRNFVGFCVCCSINVSTASLDEVMAYLEYLVENGVSANMLANNVSALKAHFVMLGLGYLLEHPRVRYFVKSVKINRLLCPVHRNTMSLDTLTALIHQYMALALDLPSRPFSWSFSLVFYVSQMWHLMHIPSLTLPVIWFLLI